MTLAIVILAAGQGSRMKSKKQKILHDVGGKPMVQHVFEAAAEVADLPPIVVVAPEDDGVQALFGRKARYVVQQEPSGTGHATMMAKPLLQDAADQVIVTYGDMPLLRAQTMIHLADIQRRTGAAVSMLSVFGAQESSFGRIIRDENNRVAEIVEVAEAQKRSNTADLLAVQELNAGVYCFDGDWLWENINKLPLHQARKGQEYYLTDMVSIAVCNSRLVEVVVVDDADECLGAGTREELVTVVKAFQQRANRYWMENGVTLLDPDSVYIDQDVFIGLDTIIWPNTYIQGRCHIGEDCLIGPNSIIRNAQIGSACRIEQAVVENSIIPDGTSMAPFTVIKNSD